MIKCVALCLGLGLLYSCSSGNKKQFLVPDINIEEADDLFSHWMILRCRIWNIYNYSNVMILTY